MQFIKTNALIKQISFDLGYISTQPSNPTFTPNARTIMSHLAFLV